MKNQTHTSTSTLLTDEAALRRYTKQTISTTYLFREEAYTK